MISIIVPVYNKELYIKDTINSILKQTFKNFELLLINDGSTDNSLPIIKSFKDNRIKIININNSGVSNARNVGIKNAKYKYIAFLDSDDWWHINFLTEIVDLIKIYPNYKVFATGRCRVFNSKIDYYSNEFLPVKNTSGVVDYIKIISKYLPPINSSNLVLHQNVFKNAGFFKTDQKQHEDHDMWLRICVFEKIVIINKNLSFYRKNIIDSASSKKYEYDDFLIYLKTILDVNNSLNIKRKKYFKKYYLKFVFLTFIKNKKFYNKKDLKELNKIVKQIFPYKYYKLFQIIVFLPVNKLFFFLRLIRLKLT